MNKKIAILLGAGMLTTSLFAGKCSDGLKLDFTFFGSPDKAYVVTKNTFKTIKSEFPGEKLLNATAEIDAMSIDTSADLNNMKAKWPASMAKLRDNNTKNNFFKKFEKDAGKIGAKVTKVDDKSITIAMTMNGVTKEVPFAYKVDGDTIKAEGKVDVLDFGTSKAWAQFTKVCKGFHHGKSWSEINIFFQVPASCK